MTAAYPINPMYLLGRTFEFVELFHDDVGPCPVRFTARVVAVQVPAPGTDIEWALLLEQRCDSGKYHTDYTDLSSLSFEWPTL